MKNQWKCQELMIIQHKTYLIIYIIKDIVNSLLLIYQDKKITSIPDQIYITRKLKEDDGAGIIFYC